MYSTEFIGEYEYRLVAEEYTGFFKMDFHKAMDIIISAHFKEPEMVRNIVKWAWAFLGHGQTSSK